MSNPDFILPCGCWRSDTLASLAPGLVVTGEIWLCDEHQFRYQLAIEAGDLDARFPRELAEVQ